MTLVVVALSRMCLPGQTGMFNLNVQASLLIFVLQVGCLATCGMRSLERYPADGPEKIAAATGVHPAAVLQVNSCILNFLCFAVNPWKNACRVVDRQRAPRLVSSL